MMAFDSEVGNDIMKNILEIKRKLFLTHLLFIFFISSGHSQNPETSRKSDTVFSYSKLVPLEAQQPTTSITISNLSDSLIFHVTIISDSMVLKFKNKLVHTTSINQLDTFIKDNDIAKVSSEILIETSQETSEKRIQEVIQVFNDNRITKFGMIKQ